MFLNLSVFDSQIYIICVIYYSPTTFLFRNTQLTCTPGSNYCGRIGLFCTSLWSWWL